MSAKYFAALREIRGCVDERVEVTEGTTLSDLYDQLFPPDSERPTVAFARNARMARGTETIAPGDEVAFLPPLGGG